MDLANSVCTTSEAEMARKTGLLAILWIAIFPLYRADNLEPDSEKLKTVLIDLRNTMPTHVSAELLQAWSDSHEIRMKELKETEGTLWQYITSYKGLALPNIGPSLIKKDFQLLFGDLESTSKLKDFLISKKENIITIANEVHTKITAQLQKEKVKVFLELAKELLLGTLRTHQKAACDEEMVSLICPRGTTISIQVAQYGASASQGSCASELAEYQPVAVEVVGGSSCAWPSALQYSLLQTVVEACQKKRQCKFNTSPKAFGVDPCPGSRRFVEVAYKCRPYEFRSKVGCENDVLHLSCNPHSRVAIYSAQYGRTEYDSIQCPQPRGMKEETCLEPYATETAMRECHGKRRCVLSADSNMFGKPCKPGSRTYLKVVYTCVPRTVLKERYESAPEEDEVAHDVSELEHDDVDESNDRWWGESAVPPAPAVAAVPPQRPSTATTVNATGIMRSEPASSPRPHLTDSDFFDTIYAYIIAAVVVALLFCIIAAIARCIMRKNTRDRPKGPDVSASTEIPNGFNDSISEVDNDINITSLSGPVDTVDSALKPEMQFTDVALSPKINRYVGRPVPNTYPHVSSNMYGQVAEFPIEMPLRTMPHGTLGRGVAVKTLPRVQMQNETDPNTRSLYRYSNAQYYFG